MASPTRLIGLTSAELDELERFRHTLGEEAFKQIQLTTWNEYLAQHEPPYIPGIWRALLDVLRSAVCHQATQFGLLTAGPR